MQRLQRHFAGRPFAIVAVNYGESDTRAGDFVKRAALDLTVLLDPGQEAARAGACECCPRASSSAPTAASGTASSARSTG